MSDNRRQMVTHASRAISPGPCGLWGRSPGLQGRAYTTLTMRHNKRGARPPPGPAWSHLAPGGGAPTPSPRGQRPKEAGAWGRVSVAGPSPGLEHRRQARQDPRRARAPADGRTDRRTERRPPAAPRPARPPHNGPPALTSRAIWLSASSSAVRRSRVGSRLRPEPWVPMAARRRRRSRPSRPGPACSAPPSAAASWRQRARAGDAGGTGAGARGHAAGGTGTPGRRGPAGTPGVGDLGGTETPGGP